MSNDIQILTGEAALEAASGSDFEPGMRSPRRLNISESLQDKAMTLLSEAFRGSRAAVARLEEAFSTSDFTMAAFATIDKEMLAQYTTLPSVWRSYTDVTKVNDFRAKTLIDKWRNTVGFGKVPELTEYPMEDSRGFATYTITVAKWGRLFAISWESWINNEAINELEDLPGVLAQQAAETEAINAVNNLVLADQTAVNTAFFKSANGNAPTALPLTYDNLKTVITSLQAKKSAISGRVVASPALVVVIPQALAMTAEDIRAIRLVRQTTGSTEIEKSNELTSVDFVVEPMLDYYNLHAKAATTWYVLPKPGGPRPAVWAAFLRGYETPDLRVKASGGQRVGGGEVSPQEGSFEVDDIRYRGRHIVGNAVAEPTFTYVSLGS